MNTIDNFLRSFDSVQLLYLLMTVVAALLCITFHELSHGLVAWRLGDPTAKGMGRLSLNPIRHIDPLGLLLMITAHVGWAKPVPVDMRYFKNPKRGMAVTALAGPVSNFLMGWAALGLASLLLHFGPWETGSTWLLYLLIFLIYVTELSIGLGLFNLIPIPPLDGSKILFSFFPDRIYYTILRYDRYIMLAMLVLVWTGVFRGPLNGLINGGLRILCLLTGFPAEWLI